MISLYIKLILSFEIKKSNPNPTTLALFFVLSTADAHLAAIATQNHNQSSQATGGSERSERSTAAAAAAAASAAAAAAEAAALAAAAAAEAAAANPPADGNSLGSQSGEGDAALEQEESLPEPEITPKGVLSSLPKCWCSQIILIKFLRLAIL